MDSFSVQIKACDREKVNRAIISENRVVKESKICFVWTSYFLSNFEGRTFDDVGVHQRGAVLGEQLFPVWIARKRGKIRESWLKIF